MQPGTSDDGSVEPAACGTTGSKRRAGAGKGTASSTAAAKARKPRKPSQAQRDAHKRHRERKKENMKTMQQEVEEKQRIVAALKAQQAALMERERTLTVAVKASAAHMSALNYLFNSMGITPKPFKPEEGDPEAAASAAGGPGRRRQQQAGGECSPSESGGGSCDAGAAGGGASTSGDLGGARALVTQLAASRQASLPDVLEAGTGLPSWRGLSPPEQRQVESNGDKADDLMAYELHRLRVQLQQGDPDGAGRQRVSAMQHAPELVAGFRQYMEKATPLLSADLNDEATKLIMDTTTQAFLDGIRRWLAKARLRLAYIFVVNLETGVLGEPPPGHWERVASSLGLHLPPNVVMACVALMDVYTSKQRATDERRHRLAVELGSTQAGRSHNVLHSEPMMEAKNSSNQLVRQLEQTLLEEQATLSELYWAIRCQLNGAQIATIFLNSYPWYPHLPSIFEAMRGPAQAALQATQMAAGAAPAPDAAPCL